MGNEEERVDFTLVINFFVNSCRGSAPPYFAFSLASSFISGVRILF
jgi:hypothetical protein